MRQRKPTWVQSDIDELVAVIAQLETFDDIKAFLSDICTERELVELANRWKVARMLVANLSWKKIEKMSGVSSATIAKVQKRLQNPKGGMRMVFEKLL